MYGARVVVLAGSGDNGGDALYAAARLARRGAVVLAVAAGARVHDESAAALRAAGGRLIGAGDPAAAAAIGAADLIIDGLLGIGGRGGLREPYAALAGLAAQSPAVVVATDLPSGVDADTGVVDGAAVRADVTVTFGTWKPGLLIDPGARHAGVVELIDIGLAPYLESPDVTGMQAADVAALLPQPSEDSDKYRRGVVGILAGSDRFTGAATLAVGGALRGGAGMIRLVSAESAVAVVRQRWPETVITVTGGKLAAGEEIEAAGRVQAWVAGPGMGTDEEARARLAAVLATDVPVLVDADGLTLVAADRGMLARSAPTLLTPHAGELGRLLGIDPADVEARRLEHARMAAAELGATVLVKGSTTVIAAAGGGSAAGPASESDRHLVARYRRYRGRPLRPRRIPAGPGPGTRGRPLGWPRICTAWPRAWRPLGEGGGPGPAEGGPGRARRPPTARWDEADAPIGAADVIDRPARRDPRGAPH